MQPTIQQIKEFLNAVDNTFPVPLSEKQDLNAFAKKLYEKATLCAEEEKGQIIAMVAGYTDNVTDGMGYMSILATLPQAQGRGFARKLTTQFIEIAKQKGLLAVHLYAVPSNLPAMNLYATLGFVPYQIPNEPRPNDAHLIYYIRGSNL